jgi:DNA polymerase I
VKIIQTATLGPLTIPVSETEKLWLYNGLDCCVTHEVFGVLEPQLDNQTRATYEFEKALQAPVLEMKIRGVKVDFELRNKVIKEYEKQIAQISKGLDLIISDGIGVPGLNWRSPKQLKELFYGTLGLPPIKKRNAKGFYEPTVNRDALEQLDAYFNAQPIISHILGLRDIAKKSSVLKTGIDRDGRMRTSYNIAGTTTGRFSSSLSDFGTGTNLQNIEDRLRSVFVADTGYKFAYVDLEQAESRLVGAIEWNLFHDGTYLDACESGDLHTSVCKLAWGSQLPWTTDLKRNKILAEQPFYRQHSYRHMAKVLGHGTNYAGKPYTMAKHTKLDAKLIAEFQQKYFAAFASHQRWHAHVASQLLQFGNLTTLTGRRRWFFGRRNDDSTVREAIAFDPQGSVGDILNTGMLKVWRTGLAQLLLQVHDAILIQYPEEKESDILPKLLKEIEVPIELRHGRTLLIPSEAKVGWNWASWSESNPDGLKKWTGVDDRKRERPAPTELDYLLHQTN